MRRSTGSLPCANAGRAIAVAITSARMKRRRTLMAGRLMFPRHCERSEAIQLPLPQQEKLDCFVAALLAMTERVSSPLPARHERLEGGDRLLGAHALGEQMGFLVDAARHVLRRQLHQLARH